ncbi:MAG: Uma2 family endonuclease [Tepidiformaceae bacterium]
MVTKTRVSLEEFLAMPETEPPSELIDGEVVQKISPNFYHGTLTSELITQFKIYLRQTREGVVVNEVRHVVRAEERVFLPDINVTLAGRIPKDRASRLQGPLALTPDFAIEVISPGDNPGRLFERADFYMRTGTSLLWFVDPETESITVYRPGQAPTIHRAGDTIDAHPVLRDFHLDVAGLFATLHEGE